MSSSPDRQQASVLPLGSQPDAVPPTRNMKSLQQQAIEKAQFSFSKLPSRDAAFQRCASSNDGVTELIEALKARYDSHNKKRSLLVRKFHQYSAWLRNFSNVIDIVVQTQANIGCPLWAPLKFVLEVSSRVFKNRI